MESREQVGIEIVARDLASSAFQTVQRSMGGLQGIATNIGSTLRRVGKTVADTGRSWSTNLTLPIVGAGAAIMKTGTDFDTTMRQIVALTDTASDEIGDVREAVLRLAGETGRAPQELGEAFYFLASSGLDTRESLDTLAIAAQASASGLGDTQDIAKVLATTINAYGHENMTAAHAADVLVQAVKDGTAEAADFAGVLGRVTPTAAVLGVSFDQVTAALAGMTLTGLSAEESATSLQQVLVSLLNPTTEAETALAGMGTSSSELRQELKEKGLLATLQDLEERFDGNDEAAAQVFGNIRALRGVLSLATLDAGQLAKVFGDTAGASGTLAAAFKATEGPGRDLNRVNAEIQATLIDLYRDVAPVVLGALAAFRDTLASARGWWDGLDGDVRRVIVTLLAVVAAVGPVLFAVGKLTQGVGAAFTGFGRFLGVGQSVLGVIGQLPTLLLTTIPAIAAQTAAWLANAAAIALANAPLILIGAAIAAVVAVIVLILDKLGLLHPLLDLVGQAAGVLADIVGNVLHGAFDLVGAVIDGFLKAIGQGIDLVTGIASAIASFAGWIGSLLDRFGLLAPILDAVNVAFGVLKGVLDFIGKVAGGVVDGIGKVTDGLVDLVHRGIDPAGASMDEGHRQFEALGEQAGLTGEQIAAAWAEMVDAARAGQPGIDTANEIIAGYREMGDASATATTGIIADMESVGTSIPATAEGLQTALGMIPEAFSFMRVKSDRATTGVKSDMRSTSSVVSKTGERIKETLDGIASAMGSLVGSADDSWDKFKKSTKEGGEDVQARIRTLSGRIRQLDNEDLAKLGPSALAAWATARENTQTELDRLTDFVANKSEIIAYTLPTALGDAREENRGAWDDLLRVGRKDMQSLQDDAYTYGQSTGSAYADGLAAAQAEAKRKALAMLQVIKDIFHANSPPGPESPLHLIDKWGQRTMEAWGDGALASAPRVVERSRELLGRVKLEAEKFVLPSPIDNTVPPTPLAPVQVGSPTTVQLTIHNHFGRGAVRSDEDIRRIGQEMTARARQLGMSAAGA